MSCLRLNERLHVWQVNSKLEVEAGMFEVATVTLAALLRGVGRNLEKRGQMNEVTRAKRAKNFRPETTPTIRKTHSRYSCQEAHTTLYRRARAGSAIRTALLPAFV